MDNESAARALIARLRREKHVDEDGGSDANANDLENSLFMLSEQLYSKPTHFVLELIQNADDNKYGPNVIPRLSFVYRNDGNLWIGCNELGFTEANVRAICSVASSTKKVEGNQKGYIGEKGKSSHPPMSRNAQQR